MAGHRILDTTSGSNMISSASCSSRPEFYRVGQVHDEVLLRAAEKYDEIMEVMLKTSLREEAPPQT